MGSEQEGQGDDGGTVNTDDRALFGEEALLEGEVSWGDGALEQRESGVHGQRLRPGLLSAGTHAAVPV